MRLCSGTKRELSRMEKWKKRLSGNVLNDNDLFDNIRIELILINYKYFSIEFGICETKYRRLERNVWNNKEIIHWYHNWNNYERKILLNWRFNLKLEFERIRIKIEIQNKNCEFAKKLLSAIKWIRSLRCGWVINNKFCLSFKWNNYWTIIRVTKRQNWRTFFTKIIHFV